MRFVQPLVAGTIIPRVVPESDEEKSSYSRALGRRKIRLERRAIAGESQTIVWSKENKASLIYRNVKSLLEVNAIKDGWEIVSESDGIRVAYKEMSKSVTALRLGKFPILISSMDQKFLKLLLFMFSI